MFEVQFAEKHMDRVYPGEVEVEEMPDEPVTCGDLGPWNLCFRWTRTSATKTVFLLALHFIQLDYIDQPTMSGRGF